jgi:hypothetical protein
VTSIRFSPIVLFGSVSFFLQAMADDDAFGAAFDDDIFLTEKVRNPVEALHVQKAKYVAKHDEHGVSIQIDLQFQSF